MALTRPILLPTPAFDASEEYNFIFNVIGGNQVTANKLIIRNNVTNTIVYEKKIVTFKYEHSVPANTLNNGLYYNATVITYDASGNESQPSVPIQFWCYSTPIIKFTNIPVGNIINNASFSFGFSYQQTEKEKLNYYIMNLYNSSQSLISSSGEVYVENGTSPYEGSYLFTGFNDKSTYYIELITHTINGIQTKTGLIEISVSYSQPDIFSLIEISNNCDEGYISLKSNIAIIEGEANPTPPVYIDNQEIDLTAKDSWVKFDKGYNVQNNFLARIWFRKPNNYQEILQFSNTNGQKIVIKFMKGYETSQDDLMKCYLEARVYSVKNIEYYIYSNYFTLLEDSQYYFAWFARENNIYELRLDKVVGGK